MTNDPTSKTSADLGTSFHITKSTENFNVNKLNAKIELEIFSIVVVLNSQKQNLPILCNLLWLSGKV